MDIYDQPHVPYTYFIGWSTHNLWYYGCQYKHSTIRGTANPLNLWKTYFTSSKIVSEKRQILGEPDVVQIHKTFTTGEEARAYEASILSFIDARNSINWLNRNNANTKFGSTTGRKATPEHKENISKALKGVKKSPEFLAKVGKWNIGRRWTQSKETCLKKRQSYSRMKPVHAENINYECTKDCAKFYGKSTKWVRSQVARGIFSYL